MIFKESYVAIIDNSGAKQVQCINVLGQGKIAYPGFTLVTTIKEAIPKKFKKKKKIIKRGEIHKILLCASKKGVARATGTYLTAPSNTGVVLRKENITLPFANRLKRIVFLEVRTASSKVMSMAPNIY